MDELKTFHVQGLDPAPKRLLPKPEYEFVFQRAVRLCVDCLIVQDGGVLLFEREIEPFKGYWTLPGGMVRYKETIDDAFYRIVLNELGISPRRKKLIGYIEHVNDGPWLHSVSLAFLLSDFKGEIRGSDQGRKFQVFHEFPENTQPYQAEFFRNHWAEIMC